MLRRLLLAFWGRIEGLRAMLGYVAAIAPMVGLWWLSQKVGEWNYDRQEGAALTRMDAGWRCRDRAGSLKECAATQPGDAQDGWTCRDEGETLENCREQLRRKFYGQVVEHINR
jgi:hypothetical protein